MKIIRDDDEIIYAADVQLLNHGATVLNGINLKIYSRERWSILGPNGSGKTSLMRMIAGYSFPSSGILRVLGNQFGNTDLRKLRSKIGWVHSDIFYQVPRYMTALEVVLARAKGAFVLYESVSDDLSMKGLEQLSLLKIEDLSSRNFNSLSTGERQRVLIARALSEKTELLLLDEPCIGLDPAAREYFLDDLSALFENNPNMTVLYITHDIREITEEYNGVLILDRGKVVASGSPMMTLTDCNLQAVFGNRCLVEQRNGRFNLNFSSSEKI